MTLLFQRLSHNTRFRTTSQVALKTRQPNRLRKRSGLSLRKPGSSQRQDRAMSSRHISLQRLAMKMMQRLFSLRALVSVVDASVSSKRTTANHKIDIHSLPVSEVPLESRQRLNRHLRKGEEISVGHFRVPVRERIFLTDRRTRIDILEWLFDDGMWC